MPQMMTLPWVLIFLVSMIYLWALIIMVFFLYQPYWASSSKEFSNQTIYLNCKW